MKFDQSASAGDNSELDVDAVDSDLDADDGLLSVDEDAELELGSGCADSACWATPGDVVDVDSLEEDSEDDNGVCVAVTS